jgi:ACR3 family arsenite transporter
LPIFSPLSLIGLLYTIIVLFAYQGHRILHDIGPVFRVFVPQILYFTIMWTSTFFVIYWFSTIENKKINLQEDTNSKVFGYETAVVQAFTAASNNFVCVL